MFGFIIALVLIMLGGVGVFVLYTKGGGLKALKHTLKTSYLALKNPQTTFTKGQFFLYFTKILIAGSVLIVGALFTICIKLIFNKTSQDQDPFDFSSGWQDIHSSYWDD